TCIPAEAEPKLNSSSCYPLINFTRPFCQNHGITLPNYVYQTPYYQKKKNYDFNQAYDILKRLGVSKLGNLFNVDINTTRKCIKLFAIFICRHRFPSCDGTQGVFKKQTICRESCLEYSRICHKISDIFVQYDSIRSPKHKKFYDCELKQHRNAGDSPECWYFNGFANYTDASPAPESATNTDCLYLNGSSYHGNISVTSSGIPCQSWTEQCPHRQTMNKTYPELNNAENYCRNPQNSGQRPWCFTTDRNKRWEYCDIPKCIPVDGNFGNWSLNSACNVTCGEGFETWSRECNNPEPKYGGRNCSNLGEPVEYRPCSAKPCPVNGGYSNWTLSKSCSVSCGDGVEIWRRFCDNPEPKYGGHNCSGLGNSAEFRNCSRTPCPIDGNYGNWTKSSPCSVTCGKGVEIWTRRCDNPPGKYGGNCSNRGAAQEIRLCEMEPCPAHIESQTIGIITAAAFVIVVAVVCFIFILRRRRKKGSPYYARSDFLLQHSRGPQQLEGNKSSSQETGTSVQYESLTADGDLVPGISRGVVRYRGDYMNTRNSWYDRLQLIRPLAMEWLRNAWGNVDEFGRHVYDVMQRVRHAPSPYDKLGSITQSDSAGSGMGTSDSTYSTVERSAAVILPSGSENASTTENV
ncbi:Hemicentin-1, partial [Paramuricea clavata]